MNVIFSAPFGQAMLFWIVVGSTIIFYIWLWVSLARYIVLLKFSCRNMFLTLVVPAATGVPVVSLVDFFYRALKEGVILNGVKLYTTCLIVVCLVWVLFLAGMLQLDRTTKALGESKIVPKEQKAEEAPKESPAEQGKGPEETIPSTTEE